jgi:hypothetical protein
VADLASIVDLVLFRCGQLLDGGESGAAVYDAGQVGEEALLAATSILGTLPLEALLYPQAGSPYNLATLLKTPLGAELSALPYAEYSASTTAVERSNRGRALLGLPSDCLRVVRIRLVNWNASAEVTTMVEGLDQAHVSTRVGAATTDAPSAYVTAHTFAVGAFTADPGVNRLRPALVLAPPPGQALAANAVAELLYVPKPDLLKLPDAIRDAVAWETAARLFGQDPETAGLAERATARAASALSALNPGRGVAVAGSDLVSLILHRLGQDGADTRYDRGRVLAEARMAAEVVISELPVEALLSPRADTPYDLTALLTSLTGSALNVLPAHDFTDDDDAPDGLRDRVAIGLPTDALRVIRIRGKGWTRYLSGNRFVATLDEPYPAYPYGTVYFGGLPDGVTTATPDVYVAPYAFASLDFSTPPESVLPSYLLNALILAPVGDAAGSAAGDDPSDFVEEILYLKTPDLSNLPRGLRDAVAWETAARINPSLVAHAEAERARVVDSLRPRAAVVASRVGSLI